MVSLPLTDQEMKYRPYNQHSYKGIPQVAAKLSAEQQFAIDVVSQVLPFRTNNFVVDELINWDDVPNDPLYVLNFPQRDMLHPEHFDEMAALLRRGADRKTIQEAANRIRLALNPHPAGQLEHNVPMLGDTRLTGMQHKYKETVLFFPSQGQTCHAYCTFCFRWPQFVGLDEMKFAMKETELLVDYLKVHPEVSDVLFTGGDPLIMRTRNLAAYLDALTEADLPQLNSIRIGSKALTYWPYRFLTDPDADELLRLFERVVKRGVHLALMSHVNHRNELQNEAVQRATQRIRDTGVQIRTQSPLLAHINDDDAMWAQMWREQVNMGMIPYYMFVVRDTGAQDYFGVPLVRAWEIFRNAYQQVSGLGRTVRGPSMSAYPGKVHVLGVSEVQGERVIALEFLQGRDPDWVRKPFFAQYDPRAIWLDDLRPAFGAKKFFFEA